MCVCLCAFLHARFCWYVSDCAESMSSLERDAGNKGGEEEEGVQEEEGGEET